MTIAATGVGLALQTADASLLITAAIASLLPDVDTSTSPAGKVLWFVSNWLERRFPHRSCTHSLAASSVVAIATYPLGYLLHLPLNFIHAINLGFFFGYAADILTATGCELFWPSTVRAVWPGNRNYRLKTDSRVEKVILVALIILLIGVITLNAKGGIIIEFDRLLANPDGVEQVYNRDGGTHLIVVHIKGVRASDRTSISADFWLIEAHGSSFIVQSPKSGEIYKAGTEPDCQIITEDITADPGIPAITTIESVELDEEQISTKLEQFYRAGAMVFVTGQLSVDDEETLKHILPDSYQFPTIHTDATKVIFDVAPLATVLSKLGDELGTGHLSIRSIYVQKASPNQSSKS